MKNGAMVLYAKCKGRDQEVGFGIKVNSRVECRRGKGPMQAGEE